MPENAISYDHDDLRASLTKAMEELDALDGAAAGADGTGAGLDPDTAKALTSNLDKTREELKKATGDSETGVEASKDAEEIDEKSAEGMDSESADFDSQIGGSGAPAPGVGASDVSTGLSSDNAPVAPQQPMPSMQQGISEAAYAQKQQQLQAQIAQQAAAQQAANRPVYPAPIQTSMQGPVNYAAYTPTPQTANQYDLNNAPNREELANAIYESLKEAEGDGEDGEDGAIGSEEKMASLGSIGGGSAEDVVKLAHEYEAAGIPYAWGGGHGAEPGPSQGTSDGGGAADANGDYNKTGLDCSGLARDFHFKMTGEDINGTAESMYSSGQVISKDEAKPGDLYFPTDAGRPPGHVQVYIGNNQVLEAPASGRYLEINPVPDGEFVRM